MKMKADFLNSIISILLIILIIPGLIPSVVSAADEQLGDDGNSTNNPNIILEEISTDPKYPKPNSVVTITALVKNTGNAASNPTSITYTIDGIVLDPYFVYSIDPGAEVTITLPPWVPDKEGTVTITASVENMPDSQISKDVKVIENQLPDLIIENIVPKTSSPQEGKSLDFTVRVKNQGISPSGAALAKYYVNENPGQDINIPSISEGKSEPVAFSLTPDQVKVGSMQVKVVVDSGNAVSESNEANNELTIPISVKALLPDLTISSLSWSPETPKIGENIAFIAAIKNSGSVASPISKLKYSINGTSEGGEIPVPALAVGEATQGTFFWTPGNEGNFEVTAMVDPDSVVPESAETNNALKKTVTVAKENTSIDGGNEGSSSPDSSSGSSSSSSSSSHSSSGGGGLLSREPASNVAAKELVTRNVVNGNHVMYDFQENSTCIIYIEYDAERTFLKTTTTVEELKNKSTLVSKRAPGRLYKYFNVWVGDKGGGLPTSLKNGSIGFKVEKAWISNSTANINESFVTLQLYNKSNTSWEPLYTKKTGEDNNYMYFKSTTPSFSSFAITTYTGVLEKNGTQVGAKLQDTLTGLEGAGKVGLNGSANNSKAQEARSAAKILMAISLPLFLIFIGYLVIKKKI